jgi:flagellar biosynthesis protein FlhG
VSNKFAEFWVFVSGKGGVGKSVLALNMARVISEQGKRVLLLDADLGLANLHVLANVAPNGRLERVLAHAEQLEEAITPLPFGPDLLASENGTSLCMLAGSDATGELAETLGCLNALYDYILVDTPRGISDASLQFCRACDRTLLVTNDEPTAITNTYAWFKMASLESTLFPVWLVANSTSDTAIQDRFNSLCRRFLGRAPEWGGNVPHDPAVRQAVARQTPMCLQEQESPAWDAIKRLTKNIQHAAVTEVTDGSEGKSTDSRASREPR